MMKKEMLMAMTVKELRTYAKENELKITKIYDLKKDELIEAISNAESTKIEVTEATEVAEENLVPMPEAEKLKDLKKETKNNGWEKIASKQLEGAYNMFIGGLENTLQDYSEDDEEYKNAYATLCSDPSGIIEEIYTNAVNCEYGPGFEGPWGSAPKEMKFAGRKFCEDFLNELLKKDGFCGYSAAYAISEGDSREEQKALDEAVASMVSDVEHHPHRNDIAKENLKPIVKPLKNNRAKYTCPVCKSSTKNVYDFCYCCGVQLNHKPEKFDEIAEASHKFDAPKIVIKAGKKKRQCPSCNKKIWIGDNFCSYCGQEVEDNG